MKVFGLVMAVALCFSSQLLAADGQSVIPPIEAKRTFPPSNLSAPGKERNLVNNRRGTGTATGTAIGTALGTAIGTGTAFTTATSFRTSTSIGTATATSTGQGETSSTGNPDGQMEATPQR